LEQENVELKEKIAQLESELSGLGGSKTENDDEKQD